MREKEDRLSPNLVILAAWNEEAGIGLTIAEIETVLREPSLLVIDGRSTDATAKIAESMGAEVISQKGKGKGDALLTAIEHVRTMKARYCVFTDADFTYPAEYLPKMIEVLEENPEVGMVCGNRFNSHFRLKAMRGMFYFGNRLLALAHNLLNGVSLRDPLTGLRVVRGEVLRNWTPKSKGFDVEVELNHHVERQGYGIVEVPISYRPRRGEKKLKLRHSAAIIKRIFIESML